MAYVRVTLREIISFYDPRFKGGRKCRLYVIGKWGRNIEPPVSPKLCLSSVRQRLKPFDKFVSALSHEFTSWK